MTVVALDISHAFDSVWHKGLLTKLMFLGIGRVLYCWIHNFLANCSIKVVVNRCESTSSLINAGVHKGAF